MSVNFDAIRAGWKIQRRRQLLIALEAAADAEYDFHGDRTPLWHRLQEQAAEHRGALNAYETARIRMLREEKEAAAG